MWSLTVRSALKARRSLEISSMCVDESAMAVANALMPRSWLVECVELV